MLLVALVPLLIMAIQGYHCASTAVVGLQTAHLTAVLQARRSRISDWLRERQEDLAALAGYPCTWDACVCEHGTPEDSGAHEVCRMLDHAQARIGAYDSLVVYSPEWARVSASRQSVHTDGDLIPAAFRQALSGAAGPVVSPPHFHGNNVLGIHMGCPVFGESSNRVGAIVAALNLSATVHPILEDRAGLGKTTATYIVSSEGRYFSRPSAGTHLLGQQAPLPRELLGGTNGRALRYESNAGRAVIGASTPIPELGWILVAEIEESEAFAWLASLRRRAVVTGALTLVLVSVLALRSSHRVILPLTKLAAVAREVSAGHSEKRLGTLRGREPRDVAHAFNSMLDELSATHSALVQAASLAAIGELSSSIVHEMRNPLSSVKMNVKALSEKVAGDPTYAELARIASGQVARLEKMLADLLQYGKPLQVRKQAVAFGDVAEEVRTALAPLAEANGVELVVRDETAGRKFPADRELLVRAVTNLVDNAIRASAGNASVVIRGDASGHGADGSVLISVLDTGPGIPDNVQPKLFEPFFTTRGDGTGLGLANVRKIVELHGGEVSAENRPEGGAGFAITLALGDEA